MYHFCTLSEQAHRSAALERLPNPPQTMTLMRAHSNEGYWIGQTINMHKVKGSQTDGKHMQIHCRCKHHVCAMDCLNLVQAAPFTMLESSARRQQSAAAHPSQDRTALLRARKSKRCWFSSADVRMITDTRAAAACDSHASTVFRRMTSCED